MAGVGHGELSHHSTHETSSSRHSQERPEEGGRWYFSRNEIEEISPSRMDGIDSKKETYLRKSYCTFLQDLGIKLKLPQVTIATAIIFCHRFFLRQSHAKNDRRTIATVCMFLAGKVEETPRPLKDVILVSYEIMHKKDPVAAQRIKQKEVYEQQKEHILLGERVVLATLGFDLNVHHPYKPLVEAIKKFNVAKNALAQVAWNFVNDGLRTSLCLQFRPHHIAAGAIFLAGKFLKVKLPTDGDRSWWQEFDVTPRQLEEVSNQMLELYEQNRAPPQASEGEGAVGGGTAHRSTAKALTAGGELGSRPVSSHATSDHSSKDNHGLVSRDAQIENNYSGSAEMVCVNGNGEGSVITDHMVEAEMKDNQHPEHILVRENLREDSNKSTPGMEHTGEHKERSGRNKNAEAGECKDDGVSRTSGNLVGRNVEAQDGPVAQSPKEYGLRIDKLKDKIAQKRKERAESTKKKDVMDEDDLIERELEHGVELAVEDEKIKREHRQSSKNEAPDHGRAHGEIREESRTTLKGQSSKGFDGDAAEEGEMMLEDVSVMVNSRKRKGGSSPDRPMEGKKRHDYTHNNVEDGHRIGRGNHGEKEHRRHAHENHL